MNDRLVCINPATNEKIAELPIATNDEIRNKIDLLEKGHQSWASLTLKDRARYLTRARKHLVSRMDEMIDVVIKETGKTEFEGLIEILTTTEIMRFVSSRGPKALSPEKRSQGLIMKTKRGSVRYLPYGLVGIISPWNYPLILSAGPVAQALMAGNGVLLKPSEHTPLTTLKMKEIFNDSGLPEDILQVIIGAGEIGQQIVSSPEINLVCFTGSVEVGKRIAVACAKQLKPVILELGGKDPFIVLGDANIERAARAVVWGGFNNTGQTCISVERVYVEESVADEFIERVIELVRDLKCGIDKSESDFGSMTIKSQAQKVISQITDARKRGAKVIIGGDEVEGVNGFFIQPTVIVNVDQSMELMNKETFGPVIAISRVKNAEEAITQANSISFGLNASIFTENVRKARELTKKIRAGNICINDVEANYLCASLPFGGVRSSGIGRLQGIEGIRSFAQIQSVCEDRFGMRKELWWFPVSNGAKRLFRSFTKFWYG